MCDMLIGCLAVVALYLMSQWVGSSELATPTQRHRAKKVSFILTVSIHDLLLLWLHSR